DPTPFRFKPTSVTEQSIISPNHMQTGFFQTLAEVRETLNSCTDEQGCALLERFCFTFSDLSKPILNVSELTEDPIKVLKNISSLIEYCKKTRKQLTPRTTAIYVGIMYLLDRI